MSQVKKAIKSFKRGTAPGPDGMRPEHLKEALAAVAQNRSGRFQSAIVALVNFLSSGGLPDEVAPYMGGANMFAAKKKDGGYRPIAVGNTIRRLVSKCIAYAVAGRAAAILRPYQYGVGVRGGCEGLIHATRALMDDEEVQDESKWLLQVDFENAFNLLDRGKMMLEVRKHLPDIAYWVESVYGVEAVLNLGDSTILSEGGVHQGDPLASMIFSLGLLPLVELLARDIPTLTENAWFLDDGALGGCKQDLQKAIDILRQHGPERGLHLSSLKSMIWCPNLCPGNPDPLDRGITRVMESGIKLLGAPIGSNIFTEELLEDRIAKLGELMDKLSILDDPHTEYAMLKSCFALPKFSYIMRTVDPRPYKGTMEKFDKAVRQSMERVVGASMMDHQWQQATLPVTLGGLGLRCVVPHAPGAYVTSLGSSSEIMEEVLGQSRKEVKVEGLVALINTMSGQEFTDESALASTQKVISQTIDLHTAKLLHDEMVGERDKARFNSVGMEHAGDWLNTVPVRALGLHLKPKKFTVAVEYRLGMRVYSAAGPCIACGRDSDEYGDHSIHRLHSRGREDLQA